VSFTDATIARLPGAIRPYFERHHELIKFAIVGATTFIIDSAVFYTLKLTVLEPKPVTAKIIAGIVAVIASYILNREWSFQNRGGRERHHEALLFFAFSGVGVLLSMAPLWFSSYVADRGEHRGLHLRLHHRQPAADGFPVLGVPEVGVPGRVRPQPGPGDRIHVHRRRHRGDHRRRIRTRHCDAAASPHPADAPAGSARRFLRAQGVEDFVIQQ
jgi:putative flippase GtrA